MLAATHYDNLLVFVFFGIAVLFQLLSAAAKNRKRHGDQTRRSTTPPQSSRPLPREADDADQIRKFLEALGQPTTSKPPPPAVPRTDIPPRPLAPVQPPLSTRPFSFPTRRPTPEEIRKSVVVLDKTAEPTIRRREVKVGRPKVAETPPFEVQAGPAPLEPITELETKTASVTQLTARPSDLASMLRSTSGLRDAIILREIFGPPRSMQPLDLVGSV